MESFKNGKPIVMDHVFIGERKKGAMSSNGQGPYKFESRAATTNRRLKRKYWAVESDNRLFLNTRQVISSNGYALVTYRSPDFLFFTVPGNHEATAATRGVNLIAYAIVSKATAGDRSDFLTALNWNETIPLDRRTFAWFMKEKGDTLLLNKYEEEENPEDTTTYFRYLRLMSKKD